MSRQAVLLVAIVLSFFYSSPVAADMGAPFSFDFPPRGRFDNLSDYPEYVFFLQFRSAGGNPHLAPLTRVRVASRQPIQFPGRRIADLELMAVPRRDVPESEAECDDQWLAKCSGTHRAKIVDELPFFASDWDLYDYYVAPYRIEELSADGSMEIWRLPREGVGRNYRRRIRLLLIVSSPVMAILGIWWARRRLRRRSKGDASNTVLFLLPIATVLFPVSPSPVAADMSLPGTIRLVPHLRFDNLDDYPDHVFYFYYLSGRGNPTAGYVTLLKVRPGEPFPLVDAGRKRYFNLKLIAVPRTAQQPTESESVELEQDFIEPACTHSCQLSDKDFSTSSFLFTLCDHYVTPFRIALQDNGSIKLTRLPDEAVGRWIRLLVIFTSLVIAVLGIWWVRRHRRTQARLKPNPAGWRFSPYDLK